jgi:nucleotide-binding universal stress UspA family protein
MRNILVPTDFSEQASNALDVAIEIGRLSNANITLLHVVDFPALPASPLNAVGDYVSPVEDNLYAIQLLESSRTRIEQIISTVENKGVEIHSKISPGNIFSSIEEEIEDRKVDLVVMGSKGASGIDELLIGSNTEKVVRRAKCPVLTVKEKMDPFVVKDIVFATNLEEDQGLVLKHVKRFQDLFKATIHLLRINSPDHFEDTKALKKQLNDFVQRYQLHDYTTNIYNSKDKEQGIINFAEEINASIIAMGTHGRTGIAHLISGSIAEDVVNHAHRMVLTVNMGS